MQLRRRNVTASRSSVLKDFQALKENLQGDPNEGDIVSLCILQQNRTRIPAQMTIGLTSVRSLAKISASATMSIMTTEETA